jgi:hypothetical protein
LAAAFLAVLRAGFVVADPSTITVTPALLSWASTFFA